MATANEIRLAVLDGDGIGPEITAATLSVLNAAAKRTGLTLRSKRALIGWKAYEKDKSTLPEATLKALDAHEGWIVGPTFAGEYPKDDPMRGHPNGFIRRHYKLFANVRPVEAWPQLDPLVPDVNITVLRENTEGLYPDRNMAWGYGEFKPRDDVGLALRVITGEACERFARFAFEFARAAGLDRICVVHKRTALPQTDGIFIGAFERLQNDYRKIAIELVRIDTFSSSFPRNARHYRLVATTNLFGDILSDQASGLAGGVGLAPSLNAGPEHAMAQAVHGTAPDIAGQGKANPSALILSTALLMRWFYQRTGRTACRAAAQLIEDAVRRTIESGATTPDLGGSASTTDFARSVIRSMAAR
ncbi:MAG: isocitrate/isopropylmalate dehydrogenase family protein [Betaproteobacteria bacterium]|nr:MAG: isocitrate/isopropylmalate dehydrogenase family protein [Betaproteobacteria bacterium]